MAACPAGSPCTPINDSATVQQPARGGAQVYSSPMAFMNNYNDPAYHATDPQMQTPSFGSQTLVTTQNGQTQRSSVQQVGNTMRSYSGVNAKGQPYFYTCLPTGCK